MCLTPSQTALPFFCLYVNDIEVAVAVYFPWHSNNEHILGKRMVDIRSVWYRTASQVVNTPQQWHLLVSHNCLKAFKGDHYLICMRVSPTHCQDLLSQFYQCNPRSHFFKKVNWYNQFLQMYASPCLGFFWLNNKCTLIFECGLLSILILVGCLSKQLIKHQYL